MRARTGVPGGTAAWAGACAGATTPRPIASTRADRNPAGRRTNAIYCLQFGATSPARHRELTVLRRRRRGGWRRVQSGPGKVSDMLVDMIEDALEILCAKYIFPAKATAAADAIRAHRDTGDYQGLTEEALAERLNAELYEACEDRHLRIKPIPAHFSAAPAEAEQAA